MTSTRHGDLTPTCFDTQLMSSSFFKTLTDQVITVELKNDLSITGTLKSVDQ